MPQGPPSRPPIGRLGTSLLTSDCLPRDKFEDADRTVAVPLTSTGTRNSRDLLSVLKVS